jgi:DNA-binding NtrC family response regulator
VTADAPVEQVLAQVERSPFDKVIAETASALEKRCLLAILQEADGNHDVAAKVAKMPLDAWMEKIKRHNLT